MKIKNIVITTILLLGVSSSSFAYYDDGVHAYSQGDYKTAFMEWRLAASKGYLPAIHKLGVLYENGHGVKKDSIMASRLYRKAAKKGYAEAQNALGSIYESWGLDEDAVVWYKKADKQGNSEAPYNLAVMYDKLGNAEESAVWIKKAAKHGTSDSQYDMGIYYEHAEGYGTDSPEAKYWIKMARSAPNYREFDRSFVSDSHH